MASWRYTTDHDPGDENDTSEFLYCLNVGEKCPFCDDTYVFAASYLTPVLAIHTYTRPAHRYIIDTITTCDASSCLRIAQDLAAKWGKTVTR